MISIFVCVCEGVSISIVYSETVGTHIIYTTTKTIVDIAMITTIDPAVRLAATAVSEDDCAGMYTTGSDSSPIPPEDTART